MLKSKKIIFKLIIWIIILFWCFFVHPNNTLNADEGVILSGAWNLYNNQNLYLDFFEFITPGSFYLIFLTWKIFGISFWSAKIASILLLFLSAIGLYSIAQKVSKNSYNILVPILFCLATSGLPIINHNFFSLPFAIWAIYFLILGLDNNKTKNFVISGLLTGTTTLFLQTKGLALGGAITLFCLMRGKENIKNILIHIGCLLAPLSILLLWPSQIILNNLLLFPVNNYYGVNKISSTSLLISILILIITIYSLRKEKNQKIWLLIMVQFFMILITMPLPDYYHLLIAGFPVMALIGIVINNIAKKGGSVYSKIAKYYVIIILSLIVLYPAICFLYFDFKPWSSNDQRLFTFIKKNCPGEYIHAGPFFPSVYFGSQKLNATPYPWLLTNHNTPEQFLEAKKYLEKNKPSCAILVYPKSLERFKHNQNNPVENYIRENYYSLYSEQDFYIYKIAK